MLATFLAFCVTRRRLLWAPFAARWAFEHRFSAGTHGRWRRLGALPGWAIIDLAEMAALARGSARHRSVFL
jgi:hypothetical protein